MKSYIQFGRLIRVNNAANWNDVRKAGNLAFGAWDNDTADGSVYRIWANDVEYDITDPVVFQRIIDNIQSDILDISTNRLPVLLSDISVGVTSNDDTAVLQFQGVKESGSLTDITNINISGGEYVEVSVDNDNISIDLSTCTLMDAYKGQSGLAIAEDVVKQIIEDEIVTAKAFVKIVDVTGIKTDFSTNWTKDRFIDMNMTEAIESLDTSINEINGSNLIVGGDSKYTDSSIAKAIADLSTAIDNAVKTVTIDEALIGINGPADASSFASTIIENEYIVARAFDTLRENIGLDGNLQLPDKFVELYPDKTIIDAILDSSSLVLCEDITYTDLKQLQDNKELIPGMQYRIIDYDCMTAALNTRSEHHSFDIIVVADSSISINENARAINHEGDEYFNNCKLSAWQLKYCIDNDTDRFGWADSNGKGVIYYMKDEFDNECPYDFKNITFNLGYILNSDVISLSDNTDISIEDKYVYTFNKGISSTEDISTIDMSLSDINYVHNNKIDNNYCIATGGGSHCGCGGGNTVIDGNAEDTYTFERTEILQLPLIVILGVNVYANTFGVDCCGNVFYDQSNQGGTINMYNNVFGDGCYSNIIKGYFYNNTLGEQCNKNSFGNNCHSNSFGNKCYSNSFGNYCFTNIFGNDCYSNSFGTTCYSNSFGNNCQLNSFGAACYSNSFGNTCASNSFGGACYSNSFGNYYSYNSFGDDCASNSFGNGCSLNSFENNCFYNSFGNNCHYNSLKDNCSHNSFGNNCHYNSLKDNCGANKFGNSCGVNSSGTSSVATGNQLGYYCQNNIFGDNCYSNKIVNVDNSDRHKTTGNSFGERCNNNILNYGCSHNSFGNSCSSNSFGTTCTYNSFGNGCSSNSFGNSCSSNSFGNWCNSNSFGNNCHYNSLKDNCVSNKFGNYCGISQSGTSSVSIGNQLGYYCKNNIFGDNCYSNKLINDNNSSTYNITGNSFGELCNNNILRYNCSYNSFGNYCYSNSFEASCFYNSFGNNCSSNSFGNNCYSNSFGNNCRANSFGYYCYLNDFGNDCYSNNFGNGCYANIFGNYFYTNIFGNSCGSNSFENSCQYNSFGDSCMNNKFGNTCQHIIFGSSQSTYNSYYRYISVESGNKYIILNSTGTRSTSAYYQNIIIGAGVNNTTTYKTISDSNVGQTTETRYVSNNSKTIIV